MGPVGPAHPEWGRPVISNFFLPLWLSGSILGGSYQVPAVWGWGWGWGSAYVRLEPKPQSCMLSCAVPPPVH